MNFTIIIASSQKRTEWLIERSLKSIYKQKEINKKEWNVLIIDDNIDSEEIYKIKGQVKQLRNEFQFTQNELATKVLKNKRTRFMSGTGAWNTGIYESYKQFPNGFISILDDDDEYLPDHLINCQSSIKQNTVAVFQRLYWVNEDSSTLKMNLKKEDLTKKNFFIGNPGIQGSNMFFKTQSLIDINGFDETLPNTTDRDLMIRFLQKFNLDKIQITNKVGVKHYNHKKRKVNNDFITKQKGLDIFYKKYKKYFSNDDYGKSILRAKKYFHYNMNEQIVICMPAKNAEHTIRKSIQSILNQKNTKREIILLIGLEKSTDNTRNIIDQYAQKNKNIIVLDVDFNKVYKNRNYLNEYARKNYPKCVLIGRLDSDDIIYSENTISEIEKKYDETNFDVFICGNKQIKDGKVLDWENKPSKNHLDSEFLIQELKEMSNNNPKAELPSCNTFIKPSINIQYPNKISAEDHWFTVYLLLLKEQKNIQIDEGLIYCIYSLDGITTSSNKKGNNYTKSRNELYSFYKNKIRINSAKKILNDLNITALEHLGEGHEGVVFTDKTYIYKVILPINTDIVEYESAYRRKTFFTNLPKDTKHLYRLEILKTPQTIIVKYLYENSEECISYTEEEAISILTELWQNKTIILDLKPENCRRIGKSIKIIDLDGKEYNDNLFLNMCARMYLYANYYSKYEYTKFQKVKRSAINNFNLDELKGLREFVNKVFSNILFEESKSFNNLLKPHITEQLEQFDSNDNLEKLFFNKIKENKYLTGVYFNSIELTKQNYFRPIKLEVGYQEIISLNKKVSLLIKTCPQDVETITENIKHIVKQLSSPNSFYEVVVSIDTKQQNFLREFNSSGTLSNLISKVKELKKLNIIDRYIVFDESKTKEINKKWFNIDSDATHTSSNAPLAPQLYAFSECKGDYILQMDSDVLIGRKDHSHSFLTDMLCEFDKNENIVSVGFNIPQKKTNKYFGFSKGGFVPEVRMGLLHKKRIINALPLPNYIDKNGNPELTWQRSLHKKQKESNLLSIRGGDHRTYFIHPQNYRKREPYAWLTILDKVEQNILPELQYGNFDLEGSLYDWSIPKRNEKIVVVSCFRNVNIERFLRMWYSLLSQNFEDFGIILLDDNSDNGLPYFIDSLIKPYKDKVTFIKKRNRSTRMENVYRSIHYYVSNPESIIVMLDGDDALIGNKVISSIDKKYEDYNADVVVGRFHQSYRLQPHYRYPVDFSNPRKTGGNVWQHIKTFKKYLFDSIPLPYFKHSEKDVKLYKDKWFETCDDFAFMVPIIEMAEQPIQLDNINYYYERDFDKRNQARDLKELCIAEILNKPSLATKNIFKGRKAFTPNTNKVEIDITYECNLKCLGCNRSCTQSPTKESLSFENIETFVKESIDKNKKWELINILGGEPTLHPEFEKIINFIHSEYILKHSQKTILQIVSNGYDKSSRNICDKMRDLYQNVRIDYGSYKTEKVVEYFSPFNDAPIDDIEYKNAEYKKGCWVTSYCGIGLNKDGFYACAVAGGIDRISKKNMAIASLEEITEEKLQEQLNEFCKYCGNFKSYKENFGNFIPRVEKEPFKNVITKSWKNLYKKSNEK